MLDQVSAIQNLPPQIVTLIAGLRKLPYPDGIVEVLADIPGPAFFPGGIGLVTSDGNVGSTVPVGGIMVLGHNFDTVTAYKKAKRCGGEIDHNTTWRNLLPLLKKADAKPDDCFFTNAFMGLLDAVSAMGSHVGHSNEEFRRASYEFFLRQLRMQQPRTILTLGLPAARFLGQLSSELEGWASASRFRQIDRDGYGPVRSHVRFRGFDRAVSVAALLHPCLRLSNLRHRWYQNLPNSAKEGEMVKGALNAPSAL